MKGHSKSRPRPAPVDDAHVQHHFDAIADEYQDELPQYYQDYLLRRKMAFILEYCSKIQCRRGLDVGCGLAKYAEYLNRHGVPRVVGVDLAFRNVINSRERTSAAVQTFCTSATVLPFKTGTFDFAYCINVIHHVVDRDLQARAVREMIRVVRPRGLVFLFDLSMRNPLFSLYLNHVFPRLRQIDDGTELFFNSEHVLEFISDQARLVDIDYYSFIPDFLPRPLLSPAEKIEAFLERTAFKKYAMHQVFVLQKIASS